jgi:3-keto-disaccharide hydrolase
MSRDFIVSAAIVLATWNTVPKTADEWKTLSPPGDWTALFNGRDFTGWTVPAGRGAAPDAPPRNPADAGWKIENGVIVGGQPGPGQRGGQLVSAALFKDVELEFDYVLAEHGTYNSGVYLRTGYQVNLGRREDGEFIGVVVHRESPKAIRGNVLWLDTGDEKFPNLRKQNDWNHVRIAFQGPRLQVWLNGTKICDVTDDPTDPAEAKWKEAGPIGFQFPPAGESGGFAGFVKFRNVRARAL